MKTEITSFTGFACRDCNVDTSQFGLGEYYMVLDSVWKEANHGQANAAGMLCISCLERRLGRPTGIQDFRPCPVTGTYLARYRERHRAETIGDLTIIQVSDQFSRFPGGRYTTDGPNSGERFRSELLVPAMNTTNNGGMVLVDMDGPLGYGSGFLEEAFGGLVRLKTFTRRQIDRNLFIVSQDRDRLSLVYDYIYDAIRIAKREHTSLFTLDNASHFRRGTR